jgi:RES domain-containing protein
VVLWRISRYRDLNGTGGLRAGGRWHYPGQPVVYLSENPASALLEVCVHTASNDVPPNFVLLRVEGPDMPVRAIDLSELPPEWQSRMALTRGIGTDWLRKADTALLRVPSAIVPYSFNVLLNPAHTEAKTFHIVEALEYPFDRRIKA